ncbi:MAG: tetratricopeptide repeat-containing diguanylate cyclase [Betaproteobacteria bacterium]
MSSAATLELRDAEARVASATSDTTRLPALLLLAHKLARSGDSKRALNVGLQALEIARQEDDAHARAEAVEAVADAQLASFAYADALARYLEALALWRNLSDVHGQVRALRSVATVELYVGDYARALSRFEEALSLLRTQHDVGLEAGVFHGLGMVYARLGELDKARQFHELALSRRRVLEDRAGVAASLNSLGVLCLRVGELQRGVAPGAVVGEFHRARQYFEESAALATEVGDLHLQALALGNVGSAVAFLGDLEQAMVLFERQLATVRLMNDRLNEALCLVNIGEALRLCGRPEAAIEPLQRALAIGVEMDSKPRIMRAHMELSACREAQGDTAQALAHFKKYHALDQTMRSQDAEAKASDLLVQIAVRKVREEAEKYRAERDRLAEANVQLSEAAHIDALTGLANRRYLDANLERMFSELRATRRSFSVALADIDLFKAINDRFSHVVGDEVLRTVGRILRAACRPSDVAARYGGEEFVLVLPDTTLEQAHAACQRLRSAVAGYAWHTIHASLQVTISVGVTADSGFVEATSMLGAADRKLYDAKRAGRNCVR